MLAFHIFGWLVGIAVLISIVFLALGILAFIARCILFVVMGAVSILYYGFRFVRFLVLLPFRIMGWFWKRIVKRLLRCFKKPTGAMITAANSME